MLELLSNNSLFVGQLYEDKSLTLRARDLIFSTTDHQTVTSFNNSLLELIYFLSIQRVRVTICDGEPDFNQICMGITGHKVFVSPSVHPCLDTMSRYFVNATEFLFDHFETLHMF